MSDGVEVDPRVAERVRGALDRAADRVVLSARLGAVEPGSAAVSGALEPWLDWLATSCGAGAGAVRDAGEDAARAAGTFVEADRALALGVSAHGMRAS